MKLLNIGDLLLQRKINISIVDGLALQKKMNVSNVDGHSVYKEKIKNSCRLFVIGFVKHLTIDAFIGEKGIGYN